MLRDFDIFEKLPNGSTVWRTFVSGQFEAERKVQELAEHSSNEFLVIDIQTSKPFPIVGPKTSRQPLKKAANG
jgi:hypothetical protein